jgi:hypothetical protein
MQMDVRIKALAPGVQNRRQADFGLQFSFGKLLDTVSR